MLPANHVATCACFTVIKPPPKSLQELRTTTGVCDRMQSALFDVAVAKTPDAIAQTELRDADLFARARPELGHEKRDELGLLLLRNRAVKRRLIDLAE